MAGTARASVADVCYHVMNRGNCRNTIFHSPNDYMAFEDILSKSSDHVPMRVLAYCLMPNHFHLCLWPYGDGDLGKFMSHAMNAHVKAHHHRHGTSGRIWQGRFKAFPIEQDNHLSFALGEATEEDFKAIVEVVKHKPFFGVESLKLAVQDAALATIGNDATSLAKKYAMPIGP